MKNFTVIPTETLRDKELNSSEKLVYLYLMALAGSSSNCFPSINTISRELKLSRKTVCTAVKSLQNKKRIAYVRRQGKGGEYLSNYYIVSNRCYDMKSDDLKDWKELYISLLNNSPKCDIISIDDNL